MPGNRFGQLFTLESFGESHGPAIGGVVDGVPPGVPLDEGVIQPALDRRRPGQSRHTTQRRETDAVELLSGVFEGATTGTPVAFTIRNADQRSRDYSDIADRYRPGHADVTYDRKYGRRDPRGGGRASARETAVRVAGGAIAQAVLDHLLGGVRVRGCLVQVGGDAVSPEAWDWAAVAANDFFCPDPAAADRWAETLDRVRRDGSSLGAVVYVEADGLPAGLGEPVFDRLDADLAKALMSINAVKGVEIGAGFGAAELHGEENADAMTPGAAGPAFESNNAGGVLGGISTGQPLTARFAVKPTSSVRIPQPSVTRDNEATEIATQGRHDPCVGLRAVPVGEAMMRLVVADHLLRQRGQCGGWA